MNHKFKAPDYNCYAFVELKPECSKRIREKYGSDLIWCSFFSFFGVRLIRFVSLAIVMGTFTRSCEIVESNEEMSSIQHSQTLYQAEIHEREWQPPVKKGSNKFLEDDINRLFEGINLRTSKSLDLSDRLSAGFSRKNASKMPMKVGVSYSPGIGFSEPVSLKQALRGLCISQAAEMAAMKRLSKPPGSPGVLEAGKVTNLCRSVVVEAGDSGLPLTESRGGRVEISLVPEESTSDCFERGLGSLQEPKMWSATQSAYSSPRFVVKPTVSSVKNSPLHNAIPTASRKVETRAPGKLHIKEESQEAKIDSVGQNTLPSPQLAVEPSMENMELTRRPTEITSASREIEVHSLEMVSPQGENQILNSSVSPSSADGNSKLHKNTSVSNKVASPNRKIGTSVKIASKATPKLRRKSKLQTVPSSNTSKTSKESKSTRNASRALKPVIRNKNPVIKKTKQDSVIGAGNSEAACEVNGSLGVNSSQLVCQKCQCSLRDVKQESSKESSSPVHSNSAAIVTQNSRICDTSKSGSITKAFVNTGTPAGKGNMVLKFREKGDFSQSSKSSVGEYSSSTSMSEESNVSGSSCGNRPHMSTDVRWEAINLVKKQHGFLGLSHFNLLKKLGCGDIGTVYLAELVGTNCLFAIKVMDNEFLAKRKKMPRAQTEREILRMLDHPFLPTLYAQFTSDNLSCLVMEFCPGGDLHVLRQKQPGRYFPENAARFYVAEVLLALEYLHMLGIVYRDLKPENILVREDGHIMLTDFDLSLRCSVNPTLLKSSPFGIEPARISGPCAGSNCIDPFCAAPSCKVSCFSPRILPATAKSRKPKAEQAAQSRSLPQLVAEPTEARSNSFVGTHEYLAPEIIKGEGHGSAVDWWTFGIFIYELLYGKTPFKGSGNEETLANVVLQNLKFPDSPMISFQARDLIRGLLVKEPENRLGTETGAAEIKRHPFFDGLNWALIRCAIPPIIPEFCDIEVPKVASQDKGKRFLEYNAMGEHLEFELF
ncbi:hypothetical protein ACH5RR_004601 [Cinchona calisaya]|uniref:non-specific serine/threonine protein kinase n=1 Tax=Cinchona calisaya TaxID=153742 RepID=A0ABD3AY01_9GENT